MVEPLSLLQNPERMSGKAALRPLLRWNKAHDGLIERKYRPERGEVGKPIAPPCEFFERLQYTGLVTGIFSHARTYGEGHDD